MLGMDQRGRMMTEDALRASKDKHAHDDDIPLVVVAGSEVSTEEDSNSIFTLYRIVVQESGKRREIFRRYSQFKYLYDSLNAIQKPAALSVVQLPELPARRIFGNNMDATFVEQRRQGLDDFLQELISIPEARHNDLVRSFLDPSAKIPCKKRK